MDRTSIPWNVCRFKLKWWLWYVVFLWTTCVFDLHSSYTSAQTTFSFDVSEGLPIGTFVGTLPLTTFSVGIGNPHFKVDTASKNITTLAILDRETTKEYKLFLFTPVPTPATVQVNVYVKDQNDNRPKFPQSVYYFSFYEGPGSTVQKKLIASDRDNGLNSTQRYNLVSGNVGGVFKLEQYSDSNGDLCAKLVLEPGKILDRETRASYSLNISATDGGIPPLIGSTLLNISVLDVNDNKPVFKPSTYSANVTENSKVGTSILRVSASDVDIGTNGQVVYEIEHGSHSDPGKVFIVHADTGIIENNKLIDYEDQREFKLFVRASNPGALGSSLFSVASVTIHVLDENDNKPDIRVQFELGGSFQVTEDADIGTSVARIYISDQDSGRNGEVDVTLEGGNGHFSAKSSPPVDIILVAKSLDRETDSHYTLTVVAKDRGNPQQVSQDSFIINVGDINDNPPKFDLPVFTAVLSENSTIGTSVVVAHASDRDTGSNAKLVYNITDTPQSSLYKQWFKINATTGEIYTSALLDRERVSRPELLVVVTDTGSPPLSANCTVVVVIRDSNDNDPGFDRVVYYATVQENTANGTFVLQVSAKDNDTDLNGKVHYFLQLDQAHVPFIINRENGSIRTLGNIDYELQSSYAFRVSASDGGGRTTTALVNVTVLDKNDNSPFFSPSSYNVTFYENLRIGAVIETVRAKDNDSGLYSKLIFAIASGNDDGLFFVDSSTGVVTLEKSLDRETNDKHQIEVEATDGGGRKSLNSAIIRVAVLDVNDEPPIFDPAFYNFTIIENSKMPTVLGSVFASSKDIGTNADIYYSLKGGNVDDVFAINSSGTIITQKNIDHEKTPWLWLNIEAKDGGTPALYGYANVSVTVIDLNDNSPAFDGDNIPVKILEDTQVGDVFYNVTARDPDSGLFGQVRYTLLSNPNDTFMLDQSTGALSLKHVIDFEGPKQYTVEVLAEDGGSPTLNDTAFLRLTVVDVNDHAPKFPNSSYSTHVSEEQAAMTDILNVSASDADTGDNARITYSFPSGVDTSLFGLRQNGWIFIKQKLNREIEDVYRFTVVATDQGTPPKSSAAGVTVFVDDVNDNNPQFKAQSYTFFVFENEANRTQVGQVSATDIDSGSNARVTYHFQSSVQRFVINRDTGDIRTNAKLDREDMKLYQFMVVATDHGQSPRTDKTSVTVYVQDRNDNWPTFDKPQYDVSVYENINKGASVTTVTANDLDDGSNGDITYYIGGGHTDSGKPVFSIDSQTGLITTAALLDREKKDRYILNILAKDRGTPENDATVMVFVYVLDVNDNPPRFVNNTYFVNVPEMQTVGEVVTTVTANDVDHGDNGEVRYAIDQGNTGSVFEINATSGAIVLQKSLDYERKSKYELRIVARDLGQNSKSSFLFVRIYVLDSNDNMPTFDKNPIVVSIAEGVPFNHTVTTIKAYDGDSGSNSLIRYSIDSQSPNDAKFKIDASSGAVQTTGVIDRESVDEYTLNVRATDQAIAESERLSSTTTLIVIVLDVNDNKPSFVSPNYTYIMEDEPMKYPLITITAIDQDTKDNAQVKYSVVTDDSNGKFFLDQDSGLLTLIARLNYSSKPMYVMNISATDEGSPSLSSFQLLSIFVVDVNDNPPRFSKSLFLGNVSENEPVGTPVVQISAYDLDSGTNGALTYSIPRGVVRSTFAINASTGVISTNSTLDREVKDEYYLTVYATDRAFPFRVDTSTVRITVLDKNDNPPVFNPTHLNLTVDEGLQPFAFHLLAAQDPDIQQNGRVRYLITSGNEDKMFSIGEFTGELSTTTKLDRETKARYDLQIQASDVTAPFYNASAQVTIYVGDKNDSPPRFLNRSYDVDISELSRINSRILNVTAVDGDAGTNGEVVYSLSNDAFGVFSIDSSTGVISTLRQFDSSEKTVYRFLCYASDRGVSPRQDSVAVEVSIIDENNHAPEFTRIPFRGTIRSSSVTSGAFVLTVAATDKDLGSNAEVTYRLNSSSQYFVLASNTGQLTIKNSVVIIPNGTYILNVLAEDRGNLTGRGIVDITVGDVKGDSPKFVNGSTASVRLPENSLKNSEVARVLATISTSDRIVYSIIDGNHGNAFYINPQTGVVRVASVAQLDYERVRFFRVHIIATLLTRPSHNAYLTLRVNLTDENDNKPRFYPETISVQLLEDDAVLSSGFRKRTVAVVNTTDIDSGKNAEVTYELIAGNTDRKFAIDSKSGVITTVAPIDRENHTFYDLVVQATDQGSPPKSSQSHVIINIADVNDNIPEFTGKYAVNVSEDIKVGSVISHVTAIDRDEDSRLVYAFKSGSNSDEHFEIDRFTGDITLLKSLDYELTKSYVLNVNVSDGLYGTETTLVVNVRDVNDNAPRFLNSSYQVTLSEDIAAGTSILRVSAEDKDSGSNGLITYAFVTPFREFTINATSGVVYTKEEIKAGVRDSLLSVVVSATDYGTPPQSAVVTVQIRINRQPEFVKSSYAASIPEDTEPGTSVIKVSASNDGSGMNVAKIAYSIKSEDAFRIGRRSGVIEVNRGLDFEKKNSYLFLVEASDDSNSDNKVNVVVNITITDVNDNEPVFDPFMYTKEVSENVSIGTTVLRVTATDKDSGSNGRVVYSIISGNDQQSFEINRKSGDIVTVKTLDHETVRKHMLSVQARDEGSKPKSNVTSVIIEIGDLNDNTPIFYVPNPEDVAVAENSPVGTSFYTIRAIDRDSGNNGAVTYFIIGGSGQGLFDIESSTGQLRTNASFDYETRWKYWLEIRAEDAGSPPLEGKVNLTIYVKSVDEEKPKFQNSTYEFSVPGNAKVGDVIGRVIATDEDGGEDGVVFYSLEIPSTDAFEINRTSGVIFVNKSLDEAKNIRKRRSVDDESESSSGARRVRRETGVTTVNLRVRADSGKPDSEFDDVIVAVGVDFACPGCPTTGGRVDDGGGISGDALSLIIGLAVLAGVILIAFVVVMAFIYARKKKKRNRQNPRLPYDGSFDEITVHPPAPNGNINHVDSSNEDIYTPRGCSQEGSPLNGPSDSSPAQSSDTPNSASSGRGSSEGVDFEDTRPPVIVNGDIGSLHSENYVKTVVGPDSGIQQDSDQVSQLTISDGSSVLQGDGLGIDKRTDKIDKLLARLGSQESLHVFGEEGGGEADGGVDVENLLYAKLAEVDADEDESIIDGVRPFNVEGHDHPSYGGSLSSIVGSREELTGSYNWDYLLDWGPQFQPLADVFLEIGKMKDDAPPKKVLSLSIPSSRDSRNPPAGRATTDMLSSVSSLPRTPISPPSTRYTSPAFSPNFTPAITPLVTRSPSVSPLDTGTPSPVFSPQGATPKSGSRPSSMHVLHLRRDSHDGSNSDLTHSPSISDNESNLEIDV